MKRAATAYILAVVAMALVLLASPCLDTAQQLALPAGVLTFGVVVSVWGRVVRG